MCEKFFNTILVVTDKSQLASLSQYEIDDFTMAAHCR